MPVASQPRRLAHHHRDQPVPAPDRGRRQREAGIHRIAGLDPVHARHRAQQMVVVDQVLRPPVEGPRAEIGIAIGMGMQHRQRQQRQIMRRGEGGGIGQAGGVAEHRLAHAERARPGGHHPREGGLAASQPLGECHRDVVGGLDRDHPDRILDADRLARPQPELGRRLRRRVRGHDDPVRQAEPPLIERVKGEEQCHHLGDRGGMADLLGRLRIEHRPVVGIDQDRRVTRRPQRARGRRRRDGKQQRDHHRDPRRQSPLHSPCSHRSDSLHAPPMMHAPYTAKNERRARMRRKLRKVDHASFRPGNMFSHCVGVRLPLSAM